MFTWACNPKEASVGFIKKYLVGDNVHGDDTPGHERKSYNE